MSVPFDTAASRVVVPVLLVGPRRAVRVRLILDTGATQTMIRTELLREIGCVISDTPRRVRSVTGIGQVRSATLTHLESLGVRRGNFTVAAHEFPPGLMTEGLLGLDFLRGRVLTLDFARGRMALRRPRWWAFWR